MTARLAATTAARGLVAIGCDPLEDGVEEAVVGEHGLDEPDALGLRRVDDPRRQDDLRGAAGADQAGEPLGAAAAGDDADRDLGLAEVGRRGGDAQRAREAELAPAAPRLAVDRRDDRLRHRLEERERAPQLPGSPSTGSPRPSAARSSRSAWATK